MWTVIGILLILVGALVIIYMPNGSKPVADESKPAEEADKKDANENDDELDAGRFR